MREYEKKDKRVIVLTQENKGAGAARNKGLAIAKGEYLSFLDSDDFFASGMLEEAYRRCVEKKAQICVYQVLRYNEKTKETNNMTRLNLRKRMHPEKMYFVIRICRIIY
mgnify:CR=1 FL=1